MKISILPSLVLATIGALGREAGCTDPLLVRTSTGSFTGLIDPEFPNTRQFRSIPFAEPPAGSRRWRPPQKLSSTPDDHRYAPRFPASCAQFMSAVPSFWNGDLSRGNLIYNGAQNDSSGLVGEATSEDCLYLAVWTPAADTPRPEGGFPVLFFMTGGGFQNGGVDIPWQMPTSWVERSQTHIVVSINYRLSIFGFPNAHGLKDGEQNLGLLDQRAALEWVRDNIAPFGGDPERITQWGRSAGSIAVDIHAYAWHDNPIAQAYYMMSGTALNPGLFVDDETRSNFRHVVSNFGCESPYENEDTAAEFELDCMRQVPFAQLVNFIGQYGDRGETPALFFGPLVDEVIVFSDYHERSEAGKMADLPAIISTTANEMSTLVPYPVANLTEGPWQPSIHAANIASWVCPSFNATVYRNRLGAPVFRFQHAGEFPNLNHWKWLGAYHCGETPIAFGTYGLLDHVADSTEFQREVSLSMQDHILAFVKDPFNGPQEELGWEPMVASDPNGGSFIRFAAGGKVVQRVDGIELNGACEGKGEYDSFPS